MALLFEYAILVAAVILVAGAHGPRPGRNQSRGGADDADSEYNQYNPAMQTKLYNDLLNTDYHPAIPPAHDGPVTVRMGFSITFFDFIDEPQQLATVHGWSYRTWNDSRLQWNPADYNGTRKILMDRDDIWFPDIVLQNSAKVTETRDSNIYVYNDGKLRMYLSYQIDFLCEMELKYFPYDEQECKLKFTSVHFSSETVNLTASTYVRTGNISAAKDFQVKNFTVKRNAKLYRFSSYEFVDVTYTISLKRNASAYTTKLIIPSILAGFLVLATFLLPTASHEKITLCSVLFLCLIILLAYLHLIVPSTGDTILGEYLAFALFVDFFATILAVVSYNVKIGLFPAPQEPDMMLVERTEDGENVPKSHVPQSRKMQWLRYLDVCSFLLFSVIFIIGLAIILARRG